MATYYSSAAPGTSSLDPNMAFYAAEQPSFYSNRPSMDPNGRPDISGAIGGGNGANSASGGMNTPVFGGQIVVQNWWNAFTPWTGMEGEPPLLQGASQEPNSGTAVSFHSPSPLMSVYGSQNSGSTLTTSCKSL